MSNLVDMNSSLMIGTVEAVSPAQIDVILDVDAPQATALNTGTPMGFPRINGYVLVPNECGAVVGLVSWLGIERSAFPKRTGLKDFGLIDLPFPLRKIRLSPIGTLTACDCACDCQREFHLERGVSVFPSVGDPVLLPTSLQLRSIVEAQGDNRRLRIGSAPLAGGADVTVDPNKLFGHHLAVLGNTGSGKSCTIAGLVRWCLEAAGKAEGCDHVNARFIVLDPNGEYAEAFRDLGDKVRVFRVQPGQGDLPLRLPAWMWNSSEWSSFAQAAPGVQRPLLIRALQELKAGTQAEDSTAGQVRRLFRSVRIGLKASIAEGLKRYSEFPGCKNQNLMLRNIERDASEYATSTTDPVSGQLASLAKCARDLVSSHYERKPSGYEEYKPFAEVDLRKVLAEVEALLALLPEAGEQSEAHADAPQPFDLDLLPDHLEYLASEVGSGQAAQFVDFLAMRIRTILYDKRMQPVVKPDDEPSVARWLNDVVGADKAANGAISIVDLSLVPSEVLHINIAVLARLVFEAMQRYRREYEKELPTVLVLEEAHTFVQRGGREETNIPSPSQMCRETFERIAREGRKFGLGLVLSSQRPSELSPTVLSQCNTFILHRLVNDRDQELVSKLVPDNIGGLLGELPSLPSRQAILLGWATEVPTLVEIDKLIREHCPKSHDPKFWEVWTGEDDRSVDWSKISDGWTA